MDRSSGGGGGRSDRFPCPGRLDRGQPGGADALRHGASRREAGHGEDAAREIAALRRVYDDYARGKIERYVAQRAVDSVASEPWFELAYVRRTVPEQPGFWPDLDFDPVPIFARVRVPTLLFYGESDDWQPIDASIAAWRKAAAISGNADLTIVRIPGTRHAPPLGDRQERDAIAPEYETRLLRWLAEHALVDTYTRTPWRSPNR